MRYINPFNHYFDDESVEMMSLEEIKEFLEDGEEDDDYFSNLAYGNWGSEDSE